jgi:hypothetical protein
MFEYGNQVYVSTDFGYSKYLFSLALFERGWGREPEVRVKKIFQNTKYSVTFSLTV